MMAQIALLTSLRDRADSLKIETTTSPSGYTLPLVVAERIKFLKESGQFNKKLMIEEVSAMLELGLDAQGQFFFEECRKIPVEQIKPKVSPNKQPKFTLEFLEFLLDGDFSRLADPSTGKMTPKTYRETRDFIFCNVQKVIGSSCVATFYSNSQRQCSGVIQPGVTISPGNQVIFRSPKGIIYDAAQVPEDKFVELARSFNSLAARSKPSSN
jgi:hypothetical protein